MKQSGLRLTQGKTYHVVVIATDEAGGCVDTYGVFTIDTTPPEVGHIGVGQERNMVRYVSFYQCINLKNGQSENVIWTVIF